MLWSFFCDWYLGGVWAVYLACLRNKINLIDGTGLAMLDIAKNKTALVPAIFPFG